MLVVENINFSIKNNSGPKTLLWNNLSFSVKKGEWVMVMGPNGVGKSSLFNMLLGTLIPHQGNIYLDNENITHHSQNQRSGTISCVMQDPKIGTMGSMTLLENLAFAYKRGESRGINWIQTPDRKKLFQEQLAPLNMNLENRLFCQAQDLSGGQRQALSLIMATIKPCKLLLLDEITAALDPKSSQNLIHLTQNIINQQKKTCLMITHDIHQGLTYGDKLMILKEGKIFALYDRKEKSQLSVEQLYTLLS